MSARSSMCAASRTPPMTGSCSICAGSAMSVFPQTSTAPSPRQRRQTWWCSTRTAWSPKHGSRTFTRRPMTKVASPPRPSLPEPWNLDDAAAAIRLRSRRIRPRMPTAIGHCMYVRRTALELVGDFDLVFTPGYGEEVDFSQRCLLSGLCHVLADDVLVLHHGGGSFGHQADRHLVQDAHERIIAARYPYYQDGLRSLEQTAGPLSRALNVARRALRGLTVMVELRGAQDQGPDQASVLGLLRALAQTGDVRLAALVSGEGQVDIASALGGVHGLTLLSEAQAAGVQRADVVHRLHAVSSVEQLAELTLLGERVVLTHLDLS